MHPRAWSKVFFSPLSVAVVFIVAGVFHFLFPGAYTGIVPPMLPQPKALVLISGAAEIAGGAGVLLRATRRVAGLGIILLLIAVFPANVPNAHQPSGGADGVVVRRSTMAATPASASHDRLGLARDATLAVSC